jgi:hypothetical protein
VPARRKNERAEAGGLMSCGSRQLQEGTILALTPMRMQAGPV